jgi:hypothetical protein
MPSSEKSSGHWAGSARLELVPIPAQFSLFILYIASEIGRAPVKKSYFLPR